MGAPPELPGDSGNENFTATHNIQHAPLPSDESDENDMDANGYDGYEPLAMDDNIENNEENIVDEYENAEVIHGDDNLPRVESADVEIVRQVWSQPRPDELQIELDSTKTEQILNVMANFTLPNVTVPDWAAGVPEELWKNDLLQRIRQRKEGNTPNHQSEEEKNA